MDESVKDSQCKRILEFIDSYGTINPMQALTFLSVMRLAARIKDLRDKGIEIEGEMVDHVNQFGEKVRFKEYRRTV